MQDAIISLNKHFNESLDAHEKSSERVAKAYEMYRLGEIKAPVMDDPRTWRYLGLTEDEAIRLCNMVGDEEHSYLDAEDFAEDSLDVESHIENNYDHLKVEGKFYG